MSNGKRSRLTDLKKPEPLQGFAQSVDVYATFLSEFANRHPFFGHVN